MCESGRKKLGLGETGLDEGGSGKEVGKAGER